MQFRGPSNKFTFVLQNALYAFLALDFISSISLEALSCTNAVVLLEYPFLGGTTYKVFALHDRYFKLPQLSATGGKQVASSRWQAACSGSRFTA